MKRIVALVLVAVGGIATAYMLAPPRTGVPEIPRAPPVAAPREDRPRAAQVESSASTLTVGPSPQPAGVIRDEQPTAAGPGIFEDVEPPVAPAPTPVAEVRAPETPDAPPPAPAPLEDAAAPLELWIPVEGIAMSHLTDTYADARGSGRRHDAIDIMAPRGTPVRAAADGRIVKLFTSVPGGLTVYQFDATETFVLYYAHLDSYAPGLAEGQPIACGDLIGHVGSTGNAHESAPHLHFSVQLLGAGKHWWEGTSVNPYPLLKEMNAER